MTAVHMSPFALVVHTIAVHRLVQLWTTDRVTRPARVRWARWWYLRANRGDRRDADWLANMAEMDAADLDDYARADETSPEPVYLAYCWWCFGLWASIGYTTLALLVPWVQTWITLPLATSSALIIWKGVVAATARADK